MSYTVLARRYRSRTFDEVVGQGPIATTLVNAIQAGRIHHGYLFTGTRGVGKTSMARILAKALNCLKFEAPTPTPCGTCDSCRAIAEGQDIDVVEIDAASHTGVDNIRELRSNTAYRPARSRFKVYIIDEVHMLSTGAFNALLKTLEEPPGHVKFILATTEIQKVPATIRSRCQCFNFRHIGPEAIGQLLAGVVQAEGATAEPAVLQRVARLANGSMRDALSILDQLLAVSPQKLTAEVLDELLPPAQNERILALLGHAAAGDVGAILREVDETLNQGRGLEVFCGDAIEVVRALMLVRVCGADTPLADIPAGARSAYATLSGQFELSHYVQMIAMLEELKRNVRFSSAGRALLDAVWVRLANMKKWAAIEQLIEGLPADSAATAGRPGGSERPDAGRAGAGEKKKLLTEPAAPGDARIEAAAGPGASTPAAVSRTFEPASPPADETADGDSAAEPAAATVAAADIPDVSPTKTVSRPAAEIAAPPGTFAVSAEERRRILQDPVVQQAIELFNGVLVHVERRPAAAGV